MSRTRTTPAIVFLALLALLITACSGPIVARSPEALYALAKEQMANANFTQAVDTLARVAREQPEGELAGQAHVLRLALLTAMARGAREIGESYLAGHLHPDATDAAPQMRSVAIDYFGRSRRRGIEIVEALDRLLHQPPAATLRVDLSAAPQPSGDDGGLAQVRQGKMLEYDDLVRLEDVVVRRELAQVLSGLGRTPEATTLVELQPAALYLALAQEIVGVSDIYRDAALDEPRMRRVFYQRAANAASRAAELARQGGSQALADQAERLLAEYQDVLGKK
jgi:hypothetical protein